MNYKVVILEPIHKDGVELLKKHCDVIECREGVSREELKSIIREADIITSRGFIKIDAELIRCARKAKAIVVHGVGVDHIDLKAAEEAGIKVANTPEALTDTVAEFTIGALIALLRKIKQADEAVRRGEWSRKYTDLVGVDLKGKSVGILGLGRIGLAVAKRLKPFDVKLYYYDKIRKYDVEESLGIKYMDFKELLSKSDIILIHLPLTEETYHIISRKEFELMRNGVYIVNMGRGALIDEAELIKQIEAGKVAGAALDVFEREPLPPESPLTKYENVLLTPHLAASSVEALKRLSMDVARKTLEILGIPVNQT